MILFHNSSLDSCIKKSRRKYVYRNQDQRYGLTKYKDKGTQSVDTHTHTHTHTQQWPYITKMVNKI